MMNPLDELSDDPYHGLDQLSDDPKAGVDPARAARSADARQKAATMQASIDSDNAEEKRVRGLRPSGLGRYLPDNGEAGAFLQHGLQGLSAGLDNQFSAIGAGFGNMAGEGEDDSFAGGYNAQRQENQDYNHRLEAESPYASFGGEAVGALAGSLGAGAAAKTGIASLGKVGRVVAPRLMNATQGAVTASNMGESADVNRNALLGGVTGALIPDASALAGRAGNAVAGRVAPSLAKPIGQMAGDAVAPLVSRAKSFGTSTLAAGRELTPRVKAFERAAKAFRAPYGEESYGPLPETPTPPTSNTPEPLGPHQGSNPFKLDASQLAEGLPPRQLPPEMQRPQMAQPKAPSFEMGLKAEAPLPPQMAQPVSQPLPQPEGPSFGLEPLTGELPSRALPPEMQRPDLAGPQQPAAQRQLPPSWQMETPQGGTPPRYKLPEPGPEPVEPMEVMGPAESAQYAPPNEAPPDLNSLRADAPFLGGKKLPAGGPAQVEEPPLETLSAPQPEPPVNPRQGQTGEGFAGKKARRRPAPPPEAPPPPDPRLNQYSGEKSYIEQAPVSSNRTGSGTPAAKARQAVETPESVAAREAQVAEALREQELASFEDEPTSYDGWDVGEKRKNSLDYENQLRFEDEDNLYADDFIPEDYIRKQEGMEPRRRVTEAFGDPVDDSPAVAGEMDEPMALEPPKPQGPLPPTTPGWNGPVRRTPMGQGGRRGYYDLDELHQDVWGYPGRYNYKPKK